MTALFFRFIAWMALATVLFVTLAPIEYRPTDILAVDMDRMLACAFMAILFALAYPRHIVLIGAVMIAGAAAIEVLQVFSPSRHARFDDAAVKAFGAFLGIGIGWLLNEARVSLKKMGRNVRVVKSYPRFEARDRVRKPARTMAHMPVNSSMIKVIYFSADSGHLRVCLQNGQERIFEGVPELEAMAIAKAKSPGQYYIDHIRPKFRRIAA